MFKSQPNCDDPEGFSVHCPACCWWRCSSPASPKIMLGHFARAAVVDSWLVTIDGEITPAMAHYVTGAIQQAGDGHARLVFEMDTPGGLIRPWTTSSGDILDSHVPVIVYVAPRGARAASAGVYITYAAHVAAMAPATPSARHRPFRSGQRPAERQRPTMNAKITNDAVAQIRNLADASRAQRRLGGASRPRSRQHHRRRSVSSTR